MKKTGLTAILLALCLLLGGCARQGGTTITVQEIDPALYTGAEYYAPDSAPAYSGEAVIPAPADVTDWAQARRENEAGVVIEAPPVVDMSRGDFTYGVVVDQGVDIHPLRTVYKDMYSVNRLMFESLVELDANLEPVAQLADTWSVEGKVWTFSLRSGVLFHNGKSLSALDVIASYETIRNSPGTCWYEMVDLIEGMEAVDDLTLRVTAKSRGQILLYAMTFPIVQSDTVNSACMGLDMPMGTGPYWIIQYDESTSLRLENNPLWWRRASGNINSVVVLFYKNTRSALIGLELDEIDALATDYPTASLSKNLSDRITLNYSTQTYECLVPNLHGALLSDLNVRQALMYAVDRTTLGNTAYAGLAQESEVPVIPGSYLYDAKATRYHYSPERALQILQDAGWSDQDQNGILEKEIAGSMRSLSLRLSTYDRGTTATRSEAAEMIARQLRLVGFEVTVEINSSERVKKRLKEGDFDLVLCGFETAIVPNLAFLLAGTGSANYSGYRSDAMDSALHAAYYAESRSELIAAMSKVQMLVVEDLPILGLFFRAGVLTSRQSLGGLTGTWQYDALRGLPVAIPAN